MMGVILIQMSNLTMTAISASTMRQFCCVTTATATVGCGHCHRDLSRLLALTQGRSDATTVLASSPMSRPDLSYHGLAAPSGSCTHASGLR